MTRLPALLMLLCGCASVETEKMPMEATVIYGRGRFPAVAPKGFCRGCRGPLLEKYRRTWCSQACKDKYDPYLVKLAVIKRDKGICQKCGLDIEKAIRDWRAEKGPKLFTDQYWKWSRAHRRECPRAEYDHIIPFSEGGLTVLENMRTLCRPCHVAVTAEWRRKKAADKKAAKMLEKGEAMTQRQVTIGWDAPTEGPTPEGYILRRWHPEGGKNVVTLEGATFATDITIMDESGEHFYTVRSVANGIESPDSLPLYVSFAITDLDIRDNGVVVKFACEPETTYWLEVSRDQGKTWTEVGEILTGNDQREAGIGGDVMVGQREWYRVWKRL